MKEHPDLIFNDATVQLFPIEENINDYLGSDIIELIHKTDPRICNNAFVTKKITLLYLTIALISSLLSQN